MTVHLSPSGANFSTDVAVRVRNVAVRFVLKQVNLA